MPMISYCGLLKEWDAKGVILTLSLMNNLRKLFSICPWAWAPYVFRKQNKEYLISLARIEVFMDLTQTLNN